MSGRAAWFVRAYRDFPANATATDVCRNPRVSKYTNMELLGPKHCTCIGFWDRIP